MAAKMPKCSNFMKHWALLVLATLHGQLFPRRSRSCFFLCFSEMFLSLQNSTESLNENFLYETFGEAMAK